MISYINLKKTLGQCVQKQKQNLIIINLNSQVESAFHFIVEKNLSLYLEDLITIKIIKKKYFTILEKVKYI